MADFTCGGYERYHNALLPGGQPGQCATCAFKSHDIYALQKKGGAVYFQELAAEARRLGYAVDVARDSTFDLATEPEIVIDAFSHRTADIEAELEAHGRRLANASVVENAAATLATRAQARDRRHRSGRGVARTGRHTGTREGIRRRITGDAWARAARCPVSFDDRALATDQAVTLAVAKLSELASTVASPILEADAGITLKGTHPSSPRRDCPRRACRHTGRAIRIPRRDLHRWLRHRRSSRDRADHARERDGRTRTTRPALQPDRGGTDYRCGRTGGRRPRPCLDRGKAPRATGAAPALASVQGAAGTAKTSTVLKTYAKSMRERRFTVRAVTPTGTAEQTLASAIGAEPMTVAGLFITEHAHDSNTIEIVDEASLTSARDMERLFARAQRHGTRLVLVGDTRHLGSVGAGRAFAQLQEHGMKTHKLDQIVRQTNPQTLAADEAMLAGNTDEVFLPARRRRRRLRPGWVRTIHSAQGPTATHVIARLEAFRANTVDASSAYVAISRACEGAAIYTDCRTKLTGALGLSDVAQVGAIDEAWRQTMNLETDFL